MPIPVIASGGVGCVEHIVDAVREGHAEAVSFASLLHYNFMRRLGHEADEFSDDDDVEFRRSRAWAQRLPQIVDVALPEIKRFLTEQDIECRH